MFAHQCFLLQVRLPLEDVESMLRAAGQFEQSSGDSGVHEAACRWLQAG